MSATRSVKREPHVAPAPRIAVKIDTAAAMLGISVSTFQDWVRLRILPKPRTVNRNALWLVSELEAAANDLPVSDDKPLPRLEPAE